MALYQCQTYGISLSEKEERLSQALHFPESEINNEFLIAVFYS